MTLRGDIRGRTCKLCKNDFRKTCPEIKRLTEENENLRNENTTLRDRIFSIESQLAAIKGDIWNEIMQELGATVARYTAQGDSCLLTGRDAKGEEETQPVHSDFSGK